MEVLTKTFYNAVKIGNKDGNKGNATIFSPCFLIVDKQSNIIFSQPHSIRKIILPNTFFDLKLIWIQRLLSRECENNIYKRLLLNLISIQIIDIWWNVTQKNHTFVKNEREKYLEFTKKLKKKKIFLGL